MRRLVRVTFNGLAVLSLLTAMLLAWAWGRSGSHEDNLRYLRRDAKAAVLYFVVSEGHRVSLARSRTVGGDYFGEVGWRAWSGPRQDHFRPGTLGFNVARHASGSQSSWLVIAP